MTNDELRLAAAVMQSAAEGRMIHHRSRRGGDWVETNPTQAKWNWGINEYMAEGVEMRTLQTAHGTGSALFGDSTNRSDWSNPDHLTDEQVEVQNGWRLLTMGEVGYDENGRHHDNRVDCQMWAEDHWSTTMLFGPTSGQTFRTLSPLPQTTSQVHLDGTRAAPCLQFHNPINLPSAGDGHRFLHVGEATSGGAQYWDESYREWRPSHRGPNEGISPVHTYRVPVSVSRPLPMYNLMGDEWQLQDPRPIQNPAGVTQEQLQPELGWRFCLQSEMDLMPQDAEHWHSGEWGHSGYNGRSNTDHNREYGSYRTRTPLPPNPNQTPVQLLEDTYRELTSPDHAPQSGYITCIHPPISIPEAYGTFAEEDDIAF